MRALLLSRGLTANDIWVVFSEFDTSGDNQLDYPEFDAAMRCASGASNHAPVATRTMRRLLRLEP